MPDYFSLVCLNCGGKLQILNDKQHFRCPYCGTHHIIRPETGMVMLADMNSSLKAMQEGMAQTASELAIRRLKEEINTLSGGKSAAEMKVDLWNDWKGTPTAKFLLSLMQALILEKNPQKKVSGWRAFLGLGVPDEELLAAFFDPLTTSDLDYLIQHARSNGPGENYSAKVITGLTEKLECLKKLTKKLAELDYHERVVSSVVDETRQVTKKQAAD